MQTEKYPAIYADAFQYYPNVWIQNTGETLFLEIDGVILSSHDFDSWKVYPVYLEHTPDLDKLQRFEFTPQGYLQNFTISWEMPLVLIDKNNHKQTVQILLRYRAVRNGGFDLSFEWLGKYLFFTKLPDFEAILAQIKTTTGLCMQNCFGCKWSDYSVYGQSAFGSLMCFQHIRNLYPDIPEHLEYQHYKDYYMDAVMDNYERFVQETYCCAHFTPRPDQNTGYRG
jgi:Family of unknown function (DUF6304)